MNEKDINITYEIRTENNITIKGYIQKGELCITICNADVDTMNGSVNLDYKNVQDLTSFINSIRDKEDI